MPKLLPLTPGLVASAMMRLNHAVFMPDMGFDDPMFLATIGRPEDRIPQVMDEVLAKRTEAEVDRLVDLQQLEEHEGRGFYAPDKEEWYRAQLAAFPGMLERAERLVAERAGS